jgi:hypothetical protein
MITEILAFLPSVPYCLKSLHKASASLGLVSLLGHGPNWTSHDKANVTLFQMQFLGRAPFAAFPTRSCGL